MFASGFDLEEHRFKIRKTTISAGLTAFVFALLLLLLLYTYLRTPVPPVDEVGGMAVNFGFSDEGGGETQPFSYNPGPMESSADASQNASSPANPDQMLAAENGEKDVVAPKVDDKPKTKVDDKAIFQKQPKPKPNNTKTNTNTTQQNPNPQPKSDVNSEYHKGAYGDPNNSNGDGPGNGGDKGNPNGDPNADNYKGVQGTGITPGFNLTGRSKLGIPKPIPCSTKGKVVVVIKVNRAGKVIEAKVNRLASTTSDECNVSNALKVAGNATFNPDPNAPEVQEGTITYNYQVK